MSKAKCLLFSIVAIIGIMLSVDDTVAFADNKTKVVSGSEAASEPVTQDAHPLNLDTYKVTFDASTWASTSYIHTPDKIAKAVSSNKGIVSVSVVVYDDDDTAVIIVPEKVGKTVVTVYGESGVSDTIDVVVKSSWEKARIKNYTYVSAYYRNKTVSVYGVSGSTVSFKIGGKKYSVKLGKKGSKSIKVKQSPKFNGKIKFTAKKGKNKISKTSKVYCSTWGSMNQIWSCEKMIPMTFYNVKKGDTVAITAGGKTYKKKVKKNAKKIERIFKTKYNNRNYSSIRIRIWDKHKHKLYDSTRTITWKS